MGELIHFGDIQLNTKVNTLEGKTKSVTLAFKEYQVMELLMYNPEQLLSKERIIEKIWGGDSDAEYNNVEVYISYLRKKLKELGSKTKIRTIRKVGYVLEYENIS